jgi:hypothetical protein
MNIPDLISESLEIVFWLKILKFFDADADPGSGIFLTLDPGSRMEKFGIRNTALNYLKKDIKMFLIIFLKYF